MCAVLDVRDVLAGIFTALSAKSMSCLVAGSCSLGPRRSQSDQTARRTRQTHDTIVEVHDAEVGGWHREIAEIGYELQLCRCPLPIMFVSKAAITTTFQYDILLECLPLYSLLRIRARLVPLRLVLHVVQRVQARRDIAHQACNPRLVRLPLQSLCAVKLSHTRKVEICQVVHEHVASVPELPTHGQILQYRVHRFRVGGQRGRLEVLDELAESQAFTHTSKVVLECREDLDRSLRVVGAIDIPGQEAGEILDCTEGLVATDWVKLLEV